MGKSHGLKSHKPITKPQEKPLLGLHIPKKWVRSAISTSPGSSFFDQRVEVQKWVKYDQDFLKTWLRANNEDGAKWLTGPTLTQQCCGRCCGFWLG
jgi:hypothetical protein